MLPAVRAPYHESEDVSAGAGTRATDNTTPVGELAEKGADNGRKAQFPVVSTLGARDVA